MKEVKNREALNAIILKQDPDEQHADLQRYVVDYPDDPDGYLHLGSSWIKNQFKDAPGTIKIKVKENVRSEDVLEKVRMRNLDYARENIKTFQRLAPERRDEAELFIGMINVYSGKYALVIDRIRSFLQGDKPESSFTDSLRLTLAIALRESGKVNEAIAILINLDDEKQKSKHAHLSLSYLKKEEISQALRHLEIDNKYVNDSVYDTFIEGVRLELEGEVKAAAEAYRLFLYETRIKVPFFFTTKEAARRLVNLSA